MTTLTTRNTIMRLAVASACSWIAISAQAQQAAEPVAAPAAADTAAAQATEAAPEAAPVSNVVTVSGSRIAARGFSAPTPTTSLGSEDLAKSAQPNLFNTIAELPALQGSTGRTTSTNSTSSGIQGLS